VRPPILYLTVAFGAGLFTALSGLDLRVTAWCVLAGVALVHRRAPVGAASGLMLVVGWLWGPAAQRERAVTRAGQGGRHGV